MVVGGGVPVVVGSDGAIGLKTGGAWTLTFPDYEIRFNVVTTTTAGTIGYAHVRVVDSDGVKVCIAIYNTSGSVLAYGESATISGAGEQWINIALNTPITIVAATNYWISAQANIGWALGVRASATGDLRYNTNASYSCSKATISNDGQEDSGAGMIIYLDNSSGDPV